MSIRQIIDSILDFQFTLNTLMFLFIGLFFLFFIVGLGEYMQNMIDKYAFEKNWSGFKKAFILIVSSLTFAVLIMASVIVITK